MKYLFFFQICFILYNSIVTSYAQQAEIITLKPTKITGLKHTEDYYLSEVILQNVSNPIGISVNSTGNKPVRFTGSLEQTLFNFWKITLGQDLQKPYGIVFTIKELSLKETLSGRMVNGSISFQIDIARNRNNQRIPLVSYKTKVDFKRGNNIHFDYSQLITQGLEHTARYFDKWFEINSGKNPALARGIEIAFHIDSYTNKSDTVFYKTDTPLKYNDFTGAPSSGRYAAMVFTGIAYEGNSKIIDNKAFVTIKPKVYMVKPMSWIRTDSKKAYVLNHEQLHFDITYLVTLKMIKKLSEMELSIEDHDSQIQYSYLETQRELNDLQKKYDEETHHGLHHEVQAKWDEAIRNEIKFLTIELQNKKLL